MQKRILSLLVVSAVLLATGCSKSESNVSSTPRSAAESTTTSASDIEDEPAVSASSTETSSEEPAKMENDPTEESVQDNALLSMDAQELFVAASEIRGAEHIPARFFIASVGVSSVQIFEYQLHCIPGIFTGAWCSGITNISFHCVGECVHTCSSGDEWWKA